MVCVVRLALYAGLRAGECHGLRWRDVDRSDRRIRVSTSVGRTREGTYLKGPKCAASARMFPIATPLLRAIELRASQSGEAGIAPDAEHFVCGSGEQYRDPRTLSMAFAQLCKQRWEREDLRLCTRVDERAKP